MKVNKKLYKILQIAAWIMGTIAIILALYGIFR